LAAEGVPIKAFGALAPGELEQRRKFSLSCFERAAENETGRRVQSRHPDRFVPRLGPLFVFLSVRDRSSRHERGHHDLSASLRQVTARHKKFASEHFLKCVESARRLGDLVAD
jgi:hypothetical protein